MKKGYTLPITGTVDIPEAITGQQFLVAKIQPLLDRLENYLLSELERLKGLKNPLWGGNVSRQVRKEVLKTLEEKGFKFSGKVFKDFDEQWNHFKGKVPETLYPYLFAPNVRELGDQIRVIQEYLEDIKRAKIAIEWSDKLVAKSSFPAWVVKELEDLQLYGTPSLKFTKKSESESLAEDMKSLGERIDLNADCLLVAIDRGASRQYFRVEVNQDSGLPEPDGVLVDKSYEKGEDILKSSAAAFAVGAFIAIGIFVFLVKSGVA